MGEPDVSTASARNASVSFELDLDDLRKLVCRGFQQTIATAGIYKPWYLTDLRKYFWKRTLFDGSRASYFGRGGELLLGALVAVGVLAAIQLALFSLAMPAPLSCSVAELVYTILLPLVYFARYRGRRYKACCTAWRGIRFNQDGSASLYAIIATGWWLIIVVTLGLAFPFMRASLERYRMRHTLLGTQRFTSTASGLRLLVPWLAFWAVLVSPLALLVGLAVTAKICNVSMHAILSTLHPPPFKIEPALLDPCFLAELHGSKILSFGFTSTLLIAPLLYPYYRARELRAFLGAIRLNDATLRSNLTANEYYRPYFAWLTQLFKISAVLAIIMASAIMSYILTKNALDGNIRLVLAFFTVSVLMYYYFLQTTLAYVQVLRAGQWKAVARSTTIVNADALEALVPRTTNADGGLGEGLAVSLDPGGSFDIGL